MYTYRVRYNPFYNNYADQDRKNASGSWGGPAPRTTSRGRTCSSWQGTGPPYAPRAEGGRVAHGRGPPAGSRRAVRRRLFNILRSIIIVNIHTHIGSYPLLLFSCRCGSGSLEMLCNLPRNKDSITRSIIGKRVKSRFHQETSNIFFELLHPDL